MNLTQKQVLSRNLFSAMSGIVDPAIIEQIFELPIAEQSLLQIVDLAFTGPFGDVVIGETVQGGCDCTALDGYLTALDDLASVELFQIEPMSPNYVEGAEAALKAVRSIIDQLRTHAVGSSDTPETSEDELSEAEALAQLLSSIIGHPVHMVRV